MPKYSISDYDSTAANNTDVGGVNIDEGCAPSNVNDAQREVMSHLSVFSDNFKAGADIASATALPVNVAGQFHDVTGTTAITSFAATSGDTSKLKVLQFDGALTLTHHATDLILPGGANITTAAGDIGVFYEYASGDWRCVSYQRANISPSERTRMATGTYTGDGTTSQAITGVGFQPKYLRIWPRVTSDGTALGILETTNTIMDDHGSGGAILYGSASNTFEANKIISLDADGFTVDDDGVDASPNASGATYNYLAMG